MYFLSVPVHLNEYTQAFVLCQMKLKISVIINFNDHVLNYEECLWYLDDYFSIPWFFKRPIVHHLTNSSPKHRSYSSSLPLEVLYTAPHRVHLASGSAHRTKHIQGISHTQNVPCNYIKTILVTFLRGRSFHLEGTRDYILEKRLHGDQFPVISIEYVS